MHESSLADRKLWWTAFHAAQDFRATQECCEYLIEQDPDPVSGLGFHLVTAACVSYGKPFLKSRGADRVLEDSVPAKFLQLHRDLLVLRNQVVAHTDATFPLNDHGVHENPLRLHVRNGGTALYRETYVFDIDSDRVIELCKVLIRKMDYWLERIRRRYEKLIPRTEGHYTINLDPMRDAFFIKTPAPKPRQIAHYDPKKKRTKEA